MLIAHGLNLLYSTELHSAPLIRATHTCDSENVVHFEHSAFIYSSFFRYLCIVTETDYSAAF